MTTTILLGFTECKFWSSYFPLQVQWQANFNLGIPAVENSSEEVSRTTYESSLASQTHNDCSSTHGSNLHRSEVRAVLNHYSDDSDSEIFRVKRRSSSKLDKRSVNDAMSSKNAEHQVLFFGLNIKSDVNLILFALK